MYDSENDYSVPVLFSKLMKHTFEFFFIRVPNQVSEGLDELLKKLFGLSLLV